MQPPPEEVSGAPATSREGPRIDALDGLRGAAILMVLGYHFVDGMRCGGPLDEAVFRVLRWGWWGVDLFFVLSGFLITGILLDTRSQRGYFRRFYLRRTVRIFPLYYAALFALLVAWPHVHPGSWSVQFERPHQAWFWTYTCNWLFEMRRAAGPFGHFWSLAVEEQFYLAWPAVVLLLGPRGLKWLGVVAVLSGFVVRMTVDPAATPHLLLRVVVANRADGLFAGAACAALLRSPGGAERLRRFAKPAVACSSVLLAYAILREPDLRGAPGFVAAAATPAVLLFSAVVSWSAASPSNARGARLLATPALRFFGRYSYCLYVVHPFVQTAAAGRLGDESLPRIMGSALPGRLAYILACTGLSAVVAWVSWRVWESPWLKLKRFF